MFATLEPASDLRIRFGMDAPTVLLQGMTVAGS
jgi:PmbA protein